MFGTFEWERDDEKIVYGLVDQPQFFNPLRHQVYYEQKYFKLDLLSNTPFHADVLLWKSF